MTKAKKENPTSFGFRDWLMPACQCLVCAFPVLLAFVPDEKLTRVKLFSVETALVLWLGLATAGAIIRGSLRKNLDLMAAWALWIVALGLLSFGVDNQVLAMSEVRRWLLAGVAFHAALLTRWTPALRNRFLVFWVFSATLVSIYAVMQRWGGLGPIIVPQMDRPAATFGNPIFFGAFLVGSLGVTLSLVTKPSSYRFAFLGALIIQVIALFLTKSRAAWIGFGVTVFIFSMVLTRDTRKRLMIVLGSLAVTAIVGLVFKDVWLRPQAHLLIWRDTLRMWSAHPWTGIGPGAFHLRLPEFSSPELLALWPQSRFIINYAHNEYLQLLAETGLIGFAVFFGFIGYLSWKACLRNQQVVVISTCAGLLVQNIFSVDFRFSISLYIFAVLFGFIFSDDAENHEQPVPASRKMAAVLALIISVLAVPVVARPYLAQNEVARQKEFFEERLANPSEAIGQMERAAETTPDLPALENLAYFYSKEIKGPSGEIRADNAEKALATYEKIITLDACHEAAFNNMANINYTLGRVEPALENWRKAADCAPQFLDPRLNLGKVLYAQGKLKESARYFNEVLQIDAANAEARIYLRRMVE